MTAYPSYLADTTFTVFEGGQIPILRRTQASSLAGTLLTGYMITPNASQSSLWPLAFKSALSLFVFVIGKVGKSSYGAYKHRRSQKRCRSFAT